MKTVYQCCAEVVSYEGLACYRGRCRNKGKIEVEGKWYCGIHDPIKKAEKEKVWQDNFRRKMDSGVLSRRVSDAEKGVIGAVRYCLDNAFELPAIVQVAADQMEAADKALAEFLEATV